MEERDLRTNLFVFPCEPVRPPENSIATALDDCTWGFKLARNNKEIFLSSQTPLGIKSKVCIRKDVVASLNIYEHLLAIKPFSWLARHDPNKQKCTRRW